MNKTKNNTITYGKQNVYGKQKVRIWNQIKETMRKYLKNRIPKMIEMGTPKVVIDNETKENFTLKEMYELFKFFYGNGKVSLTQMKDDYNNRKTYINNMFINGLPYYGSHLNPYMLYKLRKELVKEGYYKQFNKKIKCEIK